MKKHPIHEHKLLERTLILAKHDSVQRGLVGEIIKRFENRGFKITGLKLLSPKESLIGKHYEDDEDWKRSVGKKTKEVYESQGKKFDHDFVEFGAKVRKWNMDGLQNLATVAMVFEGFSAIEIGRKIVGHTAPLKAEPGTIRGDYSTESFDLANEEDRTVKNLVHASGSTTEAEREIKLWFKPEELIKYDKHAWVQMHSFD